MNNYIAKDIKFVKEDLLKQNYQDQHDTDDEEDEQTLLENEPIKFDKSKHEKEKLLEEEQNSNDEKINKKQSLISYIGNKDIVSIEQLEGDLKEKVLKYIEIMNKMEKHLKIYQNKIQGKYLAGEKNKFYAKYVKILKGELQ
eukprot:gene12034-5431_t